MAIPTIFAPVEMDSMVLVDGGVAQKFSGSGSNKYGSRYCDRGLRRLSGKYNCKRFGVDDSDTFAFDCPGRNSRCTRAIQKKVDILIVPDLGTYGTSDFAAGPIIEALGEEAARKKYGELKALADSLNLKFEKIPKISQPQKILLTDIRVKKPPIYR